MASVRVTDATTAKRARSIRISSAAYAHLVDVARQMGTSISFAANLLITYGAVRCVVATTDGDSRSVRIPPAAYHRLVDLARRMDLSISCTAHLLITSGTKATIEDALLRRARETTKRLIRTNDELFRRLS